ncbi:hypothetical protein DID74_00580 [Candidatus Marinamargulisbacteria bacterium SCGC AG-333-B06]|nr:hypothetical protein DID74_00580 [Candidatus Marinamargulisbacteria bacterium SCGC AG-333-B06]
MLYKLQTLAANNKEAETFFDEIDDLCLKNNSDPISAEIKHKLFVDKQTNIEPFIILNDKTPVGLTWIELTTPYYGNITLYIPDKTHIEQSIALIVERGYFDKKIIEIVAMNHLDDIKKVCFKLNLTPNIRKRMYLWLNELNDTYVSQQVPSNYVIKPYTKELTKWAATLSVASHKVSKDYEMYEEMIHVDKRHRLENVVMDGLYGPILESSSLVLSVDGKMIGYSLVVLVKCWGYQEVPWIFDVCIDPEYQGKGYGKTLANEMVKRIKQNQFEIMGLAVTLSNHSAKKLYEKQGFKDLDIFYEFTNI